MSKLPSNTRKALTSLRNNQSGGAAWQIIDSFLEQDDASFFKKTPTGWRPSASKFATLKIPSGFVIRYGGASHTLEKRGKTHKWVRLTRDDEIKRMNPIGRFVARYITG